MLKNRRISGGAIAETGPSLLVLLVFITFPMMDVLYLCAGWGMAWVLHRNEIREIAVHKPTEWADAKAKADNEFYGGPIAKFLEIQAVASPAPRFTPSEADPTEVTYTTRVTIKPLLFIPLPGLPEVPGINARMPLQFTSTRPQEEKGRD